MTNLENKECDHVWEPHYNGCKCKSCDTTKSHRFGERMEGSELESYNPPSERNFYFRMCEDCGTEVEE